MGLEADIYLIRDQVPVNEDRRRAPADYIITENGQEIYRTRANENGFMRDKDGKLTRGIPKGDYTLQPKQTDGSFKAGQPATTGRNQPPGKPAEGYKPDSILVHEKERMDKQIRAQ